MTWNVQLASANVAWRYLSVLMWHHCLRCDKACRRAPCECAAAELSLCMPAVVQLRHPNILQFKETAELEERGETAIYLVTEACTPLADHLQHLDIQVCHQCEAARGRYDTKRIEGCSFDM